MALTIRNVLDQVLDGRIRVPEFQRGFVWDPDRVSYLMDSIYKGYPFGSVLLWRTKEQLKHERKLGPFELPEKDPDLPVDYLLDGQQRITSIFGVFQNSLTAVDDSDWMKIYFDLSLPPDAQESQFVHIPENEFDKERYFPLKTLFSTAEYRKANEHLDVRTSERVDKLQETFKEATILTQTMQTDDKNAVAIVFERVNQRGVELDTLQLLSAWTWSEEFDLQRKFEEIGDRLDEFKFGRITNDLILRCISATLSSNTSAESLINLNGAQVRDQFEVVETGIEGALDFLRSEFGVESINNLPYDQMLIPLVAFFASEPNKKFKSTEAQNVEIRKWFWQTGFSRRYNSQTVKVVNSDTDQIKRL